MNIDIPYPREVWLLEMRIQTGEKPIIGFSPLSTIMILSAWFSGQSPGKPIQGGLALVPS
jgi:hypothetical protein